MDDAVLADSARAHPFSLFCGGSSYCPSAPPPPPPFFSRSGTCALAPGTRFLHPAVSRTADVQHLSFVQQLIVSSLLFLPHCYCVLVNEAACNPHPAERPLHSASFSARRTRRIFLHPAVSRTDDVQHLSVVQQLIVSSLLFLPHCCCVLVNEAACNPRPAERPLHSASFSARRTRRIFLHPAVSRTDDVQHLSVVQQLIVSSLLFLPHCCCVLVNEAACNPRPAERPLHGVSRADDVQHLSVVQQLIVSSLLFLPHCYCVLVNEAACNPRPAERPLHSAALYLLPIKVCPTSVAGNDTKCRSHGRRRCSRHSSHCCSRRRRAAGNVLRCLDEATQLLSPKKQRDVA
ncbi:uncharacterized protein LOC119444202 [Dermacentor silvarum]|uniref:uncharacterized protein LOC119444202 n=1 Tax=Dermacentor silvarum TaxID=543639 RepID=UPI00210142AE|nr:uncharacterized protein LOC119444202 [Dermacentor silvarum]